MLSLLLDENISPVVAAQLKQKRPEIPILSVYSWQEGRFKAQPDDRILVAAAAEHLTLVTFDQKTIMPILVRWGEIGAGHSGVIFIDNLTIAHNDFGTVVRSLTAIWDDMRAQNWTNVVTFLRPEF